MGVGVVPGRRDAGRHFEGVDFRGREQGVSQQREPDERLEPLVELSSGFESHRHATRVGLG